MSTGNKKAPWIRRGLGEAYALPRSNGQPNRTLMDPYSTMFEHPVQLYFAVKSQYPISKRTFYGFENHQKSEKTAHCQHK